VVSASERTSKGAVRLQAAKSNIVKLV
jgi:hypothetical protein